MKPRYDTVIDIESGKFQISIQNLPLISYRRGHHWFGGRKSVLLEPYLKTFPIL